MRWRRVEIVKMVRRARRVRRMRLDLSRPATTWLAVATTSTAPRGEEWNPACSTWPGHNKVIFFIILTFSIDSPTKLCFQSNLPAWSSNRAEAEASRVRSSRLVLLMVALVLPMLVKLVL